MVWCVVASTMETQGTTQHIAPVISHPKQTWSHPSLFLYWALNVIWLESPPIRCCLCVPCYLCQGTERQSSLETFSHWAERAVPSEGWATLPLPSPSPAKKPSSGAPSQKTMVELLPMLASFWVPPSLGRDLWNAGGGHILHSPKCNTFLAIQKQLQGASSWLLLQLLTGRLLPFQPLNLLNILDFWWTA